MTGTVPSEAGTRSTGGDQELACDTCMLLSKVSRPVLPYAGSRDHDFQLAHRYKCAFLSGLNQQRVYRDLAL